MSRAAGPWATWLRAIIPASVLGHARNILEAFAKSNYPYDSYVRASRIGQNSANEWIRKSAEIEGWLFEGEPEFLWGLASRSSDGHVLEVGTWMGKATCVLAGACIENASHTKVICIDPFTMQGTPEQEAYHKKLVGTSGTFYQFIENAQRLGFFDWIVPIATTSERALSGISFHWRMIFIDGAHDYDSVKRDVELSLPGLMQGGLLVLHDAANSPSWPDVERYVRDCLQPSPLLQWYGSCGTLVAFTKR